MRIRIESDGHTVEIEHADTNRSPEQLADLAQQVWQSTVDSREPRRTIGYGSQLVERSRDQPVAGNGMYERKPDPVTA